MLTRMLVLQLAVPPELGGMLGKGQLSTLPLPVVHPPQREGILTLEQALV